MDIRLDNRTALITGGSRGLGRAMATEFARSGARVAILARSQDSIDEAIAAIGAEAPRAQVSGFACDVRDAEALAAAHCAAVDALGSIDILVNNAGTSAAKPFGNITDDEWHNDFDLKLFSAIRLARLCIPAMQEKKWGRIINVLNTAAKAPRPGTAPTSITRAAGMALTKVLSGELAPHGILVNALNTGVLVTSQWTRMHQDRAPHLSYEEFLKMTGDAVPIGRMGDASEFANMACFLASDHASYITGTAINIDGGMSPVV